MNNSKVIIALVIAWGIVGTILLASRPLALFVFWLFPVVMGVFLLYQKIMGNTSLEGVPKLQQRPVANPVGSTAASIPRVKLGDAKKVPPRSATATGKIPAIKPEEVPGYSPPPSSSPPAPGQPAAPTPPGSNLGGRVLRDFVQLMTNFACSHQNEEGTIDRFLGQMCRNLEILEAQVFIRSANQPDFLELKACYPQESIAIKKKKFKWVETPLEAVLKNGEQIFPGESPSHELMTPVPMLACTPLVDGVTPIGCLAVEKTVRAFSLAPIDPELFFFSGQMLGWVFAMVAFQEKAEQREKQLAKKVQALEQHKEKLESTAAYLDQEVDRQYFENVDLEKQRSHLFSSFQKFLSPIIIEKIVNDPNALKLGGSKQRVTVFFSDIRGFTKMSEKMDPTDVVTLLNQYFSAMTAIVLKYQGTLDKFVGDEIMALFGAPLEIQHASLRAVMCALEMQQVLEGLRSDWQTRGFPVFDMGIGLNSGEVTVGFIGSEDVLSYTAIGDTVNLASRLCSVAEPGQIVVSLETATELEDAVFLRQLPDIQVKGKELPIKIFEVAAPAVDLSFVTPEHFLDVPAETPPGAVVGVKKVPSVASGG